MGKKQVDTVREEILDIADAFYQNRIAEGVKQLPKLIRLLSEESKDISEQKQKKYIELLNYVMEAMKQKEYILLADVLVFEILEEL